MKKLAAFFVFAFVCLLLTGGIAFSCGLRSECHARTCSPGLKPVWLHRDAECICAERPQ